MDRRTFLNWALPLLEGIEGSPEKLAWCRAYSVYSRNPGQEQLNNDLDLFLDRIYASDLLISHYGKVLEEKGLDQRCVAQAEDSWLAELSPESILACITWHIRRDHFQEGALIRSSIGQGCMLRLLRRLKSLEV